MKILHTADWHLDSPFAGYTQQQAAYLRSELLKIPEKIATLCKNEGCDLVLIAGDIFDGACTRESLDAVRNALAEMAVPVFITPGNHDFCATGSPYLTESWPGNVHIFTHPVLESVTLDALDCKIYGAGYTAMDCPGLLKDFQAEGEQRWHIGVLHADPQQAGSPYAPLTTHQVKASGLDYLALGHIHKGGSFRAGEVLCAWPGCAMGRGFDENGRRGVLLVELTDSVSARFLQLNTPRFYDEKLDVGEDATDTVAQFLPPVESQDFYRITLTGYSQPVDTAAITAAFPHIPNLEVRDRTRAELDLWSGIDEDTLEGTYFKILHDGLQSDSPVLQRRIKLAARISRQILDGQEVVLP